MVHKRRDFLITFTILCLAMCACSGFQYLGSAFYGLVWHRIHGLGSGGVRLLSGLFDSPWTGVLVQYIFSIGVPFLLVVPMTCFVRSETGSYTSGGGLDVGAFHVPGTWVHL